MSEAYLVQERFIFKRFPQKVSPELRKILKDEGISKHHSARAEIFAYETALRMGFEDLVPLIERSDVPGLGPGTLQELVQGKSIVERNRETLHESREAVRKMISEFYYEKGAQISRQEWLERARRIALLDTVIANSDRHAGNIRLTKEGPMGIDHGLAFCDRGEVPDVPQVGMARLDVAVHETGGAALREEELRVLQALLDSDWIDGVRHRFGPDQARLAKKRIEYMLSEKRLHPFVIGRDVAGGATPRI